MQIKAAIIIALGLIVGGFASGGIYTVTSLTPGAISFRVNRFTGSYAALTARGVIVPKQQ